MVFYGLTVSGIRFSIVSEPSENKTQFSTLKNFDFFGFWPKTAIFSGKPPLRHQPTHQSDLPAKLEENRLSGFRKKLALTVHGRTDGRFDGTHFLGF